VPGCNPVFYIVFSCHVPLVFQSASVFWFFLIFHNLDTSVEYGQVFFAISYFFIAKLLFCHFYILFLKNESLNLSHIEEKKEVVLPRWRTIKESANVC
jgi:hypothetical protein